MHNMCEDGKAVTQILLVCEAALLHICKPQELHMPKIFTSTAYSL